LLNAKLSEMADNLELAEEQIWQFIAWYQGVEWTGEIEYPGSFNIQDRAGEFKQLTDAKSAATDPRVLAVIDHKIVDLLDEDPNLVLGEEPGETPATEAVDAEEEIAQGLAELMDTVTGDKQTPRTKEEYMALREQGYIEVEMEKS